MKRIPQQLKSVDINVSDIMRSELSDFIVESEQDDRRNINYLMNSMVYQSTRLNITLMMTMKCNFRCVYCFESWIPNEQKCNELDENAVVDWIIWLVKRYHIRQVDLCFHGGEPLLETNKIIFISKALKEFFENNNVFYLFTIVTNGYLLTKDNTVLLSEAGVKIAQITIDGIKAIHDKRRPLANGYGTFSTIIDNINHNNSIRIYLSIVYDRTNAQDIYQLIDYLAINKMQKNIRLIVLSATKPIVDQQDTLEYQLTQTEDAQLRVLLLKYITDKGFRVPFGIDYQLCTMKQKNSFVLTPDEIIYKCISGVGKEEFRLGELKIGLDPFKLQSSIIENNSDDDCQKCAYMPICNRFCLYESYVMKCGKICKKEYWHEFLQCYFAMYLKSNHKANFVLNPSAEEWEINYVD
jgi:uncharacterized protein